MKKKLVKRLACDLPPFHNLTALDTRCYVRRQTRSSPTTVVGRTSWAGGNDRCRNDTLVALVEGRECGPKERAARIYARTAQGYGTLGALCAVIA